MINSIQMKFSICSLDSNFKDNIDNKEEDNINKDKCLYSH